MMLLLLALDDSCCLFGWARVPSSSLPLFFSPSKICESERGGMSWMLNSSNGKEEGITLSSSARFDRASEFVSC